MSSDTTVFELLCGLFPPRPPRDSTDRYAYAAWPWAADARHYTFKGRMQLTQERRDQFLNFYAVPPYFPFDMFAVAALLLETSGAYHHVVPALKPNRKLASDRAQRLVRVSQSEINQCRRLGRLWREIHDEVLEMKDPSLHPDRFARWKEEMKLVNELWTRLFAEFGSAPVFTRRLIRNPSPTGPANTAPPWWKLALMLFMIADEAADQFGFLAPERLIPALDKGDERRSGIAPPLLRLMDHLVVHVLGDGGASPNVKGKVEAAAPVGATEAGTFIDTLSEARQDIVSVVPKARTTPVGCTLRSLSHHLALLPPRGVARANWIPRLFAEGPHSQSEFNLLLVPYPFSIAPHQFVGQPGLIGERKPTGLFCVDQDWLRAYRPSGWPDGEAGRLGELRMAEMLAKFIAELADVARTTHHANEIHAIVLPEYALSFPVFHLLQERLRDQFAKLELFVSGLSQDQTLRKGNFVAVSTFGDVIENKRRIPTVYTTIREKHHRWRLDGSQIRAYGLEGVLNTGIEWWEDIDLMSRRVDFSVFRQTSTLSVMICEDLARVDPCQELLRAVGPNLVFALLMDGPQLPTRWPARYATILSEDPGCSVLTLTSRALMTLQHHNKRQRSRCDDDRVIGLWRDDGQPAPVPILCPNDCHGVWLRVFGLQVTDLSFDGRDDGSALSWRFAEQKPLALDDVDKRYGALLGRQDRALRTGEPWDRGP